MNRRAILRHLVDAIIGDPRLIPRLAALVRPYLVRLLIAGICQAFATIAFLLLPYITRSLVDSAFVHHTVTGLNRIGALLLVLALVSALFAFLRGYLLAHVGGRVVADLRIRLYQHLLSLSIAFSDERRAGDTMSRLTSDTGLIQTVVTDSLLSLGQNVLTVGGIIVLILILDWRLALLSLVLAPLVALIGLYVGRRTRQASQAAQTGLGLANIVLDETLSTQRIVQAFGREPYEVQRYARTVDQTFHLGLLAARLRAFFESTTLMATVVAITGVLWLGSREVVAGRLTAGGLVAFLLYLTLLSGPLQALASLFGTLQVGLGGAARVFELLDLRPSIVDAPNARRLPAARGHVEARNVWFSYQPNAACVLRGVTIEAQSGQTVALVGPSGAGKTTLVSLLPRFYDPVDGAITLDGYDLRSLTLESLRSAIGLVPQEPALFGGSVRENIAYGRLTATREEIEAAARLANADEFIETLPNGYETLIGDRGARLSGGQRQRIAIARAILKDPQVLILDEATNSLDNESEALVQEALARLMLGRTTFAIAHRLSTVEHADLIVVLDAGRVAEQGTHAELLIRRGLYYRLYTRAFATEAGAAI